MGAGRVRVFRSVRLPGALPFFFAGLRIAITYAVVADSIDLPFLSGALQADLAVTSVSRLPPLREVLMTDEPLVDDQTIWRRTMR